MTETLDTILEIIGGKGWSLYLHKDAESYNQTVEGGYVDGVARKLQMGSSYLLLAKTSNPTDPAKVRRAQQYAMERNIFPILFDGADCLPMPLVKLGQQGAIPCGIFEVFIPYPDFLDLLQFLPSTK